MFTLICFLFTLYLKTKILLNVNFLCYKIFSYYRHYSIKWLINFHILLLRDGFSFRGAHRQNRKRAPRRKITPAAKGDTTRMKKTGRRSISYRPSQKEYSFPPHRAPHPAGQLHRVRLASGQGETALSTKIWLTQTHPKPGCRSQEMFANARTSEIFWGCAKTSDNRQFNGITKDDSARTEPQIRLRVGFINIRWGGLVSDLQILT